MQHKQSSRTAYILGLIVAVLVAASCGDNIHPAGSPGPDGGAFTKDITQFTILGVDGVITGTGISVTLPAGTDVTSLKPTITITGVSVSPTSGAAVDFTDPVPYTVTAGDGSTQIYSVTVTTPSPGAKDIIRFTILGVDGTISGTEVSLTLPFGTDPTSLTPTITITGVSVSPASAAAQSFVAPVLYTVTAQDGTTKTYTVTVTIALNSAKDITRFTILGVDGTISGTSISLTLPFGTSVTSLTPSITITGTSVSPASGVAQDFTAPVVYTVQAADGSARQYTATVNLAASSAKDITRFVVEGFDAAIGTISATTGVVTLDLPNGTNLTSLLPTVTINGVSLSPASGVARDFTSPVTYVVTAADGSTKTYTVIIGTVNGGGTKLIKDFIILGVHGAITNGAMNSTITLTLPPGTDLSAQTPTIITNASNINPPSGVPRDFTSPVTYTVTAANGATHVYTVTVTVAP